MEEELTNQQLTTLVMELVEAQADSVALELILAKEINKLKDRVSRLETENNSV